MRHIELLGTVGPTEARALKVVLLELCDQPRPQIEVDMRGIEDLHLTGVNSVIAAAVAARKNAGTLTIKAPADGAVRRALELTALERLLER